MSYKTISMIVIALAISQLVYSQGDFEVTKSNVNTVEAASHIWFLADDVLMGRNTGSPEIEIAARYIASQLRKYGVESFDDTGNYMQTIALESSKPPTQGELRLDDFTFSIGKNLVYMESADIGAEANIYFSEYGLPEELREADLDGKIVICKAGKPGENNPRGFFGTNRRKQAAAREGGAIALVELYNSSAMPWSRVMGYQNRDRLSLVSKGDVQTNGAFGSVWLHDPEDGLFTYLNQNNKRMADIKFSSRESSAVMANNVIGYVEGSHPVLKNEYVLLSAHYDHIGFQRGTNGEDSIYNGARDNAIGVAAILGAMQSFSLTPAKRSVLFLACTGEEKGLLGSRWYADHPPVSLKQIVFNLNIDGGGYNDVTKVAVMGLNRTTAAQHLKSASADFGLEAFADPAPEQNLFDRSDNVSFAAKGIPAPTFSTGFTSFDAEIMKYYHQVTDETASLDFEYLSKYFLAYALAARRVANMAEAPFWLEGDKYESAGKKLYELE